MIANLTPYPDMKDSGVKWLGLIPEHWEILRGKVLFRCIDVRSATGEEELLTVSSDRGIVPRESAAVTMFKAESYVGHKLCWPGDLVINSLWAWSRGLGISQYHGIVSTAYGVYRLRRPMDVSAAYIDALVRSIPFNWELRVRSKGIWISRLQLSDDAFLGAPFPVPPASEQPEIARFLDLADRRIRRYIRAKERLIELLEEQKQAIIHQAVTGQIDVRTGLPYPAYKDAAVEWLGMVPENWKLMPLKWLSERTQNGATPPSSNDAFYQDGTVPWYGPASCGTGEDVGPPIRYLNSLAFSQGRARLVRGPALLLIVIGATAGRIALMPEDGSTNQQITAYEISTDFVRPRFILRQLQRAESWLQSTASSATIPIINSSVVNRLPCAIPPLDEQDSIISALKSDCSRIDSAVASNSRQIELLREYRTRLIADVVTGKLDVREAAAAMPEEPDVVTDAMETIGLVNATETAEEVAL